MCRLCQWPGALGRRHVGECGDARARQCECWVVAMGTSGDALVAMGRGVGFGFHGDGWECFGCYVNTIGMHWLLLCLHIYIGYIYICKLYSDQKEKN